MTQIEQFQWKELHVMDTVYYYIMKCGYNHV
jgi:hypothetical protein